MGRPATLGVMSQEQYRKALEIKAAELSASLRNREGIHIETASDMQDEVQQETERDLIVTSLDRDSQMLRHVRAALKRLADGSFGVCVDCEEPIGAKRLAAVTWAARCLRCQERADENGDGRLAADRAGGALIAGAGRAFGLGRL